MSKKATSSPVRLGFDARRHLHRRHRVRPVVQRADGAQRDGLRPQRVEQFLADQPGGRHHLLCRRRDRKTRRHEGRYAGRDHGHPRHRGAGRDRLQLPGQNGLPDAKFQVLVEPDGTTGSYILFDKTTLVRSRWSIRPDSRSTSIRASSASPTRRCRRKCRSSSTTCLR